MADESVSMKEPNGDGAVIDATYPANIYYPSKTRWVSETSGNGGKRWFSPSFRDKGDWSMVSEGAIHLEVVHLGVAC